MSAAVTAQAQDAGSFYLDRAQIAGGPDDPFMTWRPFFSDKTRFYGSATLGYSLNPLRASSLTEDSRLADSEPNPFAHEVTTYLGAGVQLNKRLAFELMLPIAWISAGDEPSNIGSGFQNGTTLYDLRLSLRALAVESDDKKFRWGAGGALTVPTGTETRFGSDGETGVWLFTNAEHHFDDWMLVWMVGPHFRQQQGPRPSSLQVGNEARYSIGGFVPMRGDDLQIGVELFGSLGFDEVIKTEGTTDQTENAFLRGQNSPLEWLAQGRWNMGKEKKWYIMAGGGTRLTPGYGAPDIRLLGQIGSHVYLSDIGPDSEPKIRKPLERVSLEPDKDTDGDGFPDDIDQCVTIKEDGKPPYPDDGCPDLDTDDDGILDKDDKCVTVPEDKDGIQDEDGCPEEDADKDGVLDVDDACPEVKGVKSEDAEKNGCPEEKKKKIFVGRNEIQLLEPIQFEYNRANILPVSFPILDEVVELMKDRTTLRLGIYGHTDNQGGADYNKALSDRRATAVVNYIVNKGIAKERLESAGYGMERPVGDNNTEEGRAKNRRVEFKILRQ